MIAVLPLLAALVGLVIGSFLNVVIHRVPRNESIVRPPSACPGCGTPIAPRDNVPVVSWLLLWGRCRTCRMPISVRYPLVEAGTAVLFALVALRIGLTPELPAFLYLAAIAVALAMIDLDVQRLHDSIVLPSYVVATVLLAVPIVLEQDWYAALRVGVGLAALYGFYFLLVLVYPGGMGFGDVKLAGVLGMYLGYLGYAELAVGAFLGFLLGGLVGGGLMVARKAGRKSKIPFGPFMLAGALIAVLATDPIAGWYLDVVGL